MSIIEYPPSVHTISLKAYVNYSIFNLQNGDKVISSYTLKRFEADVPWSGFLRVNRSILLNPIAIKTFEHNAKKCSIELINGEQVVGSRRKIGKVLNLLNYETYTQK